jgi:hypothetical protein
MWRTGDVATAHSGSFACRQRISALTAHNLRRLTAWLISAHIPSHAEGVFLRHVLEHNADGWRDILLNALRSFSRRMVLVVYTPFGDVTRNVRARTPSDVNVPTALSFCKEDITDLFPEDVAWFTVVGDPLETYETMFFLERGQDRCMHLLRHDVCYRPDFSGNL